MNKLFPAYYSKVSERRWYNLPVPVWLAWAFMVAAFWVGDATGATYANGERECYRKYTAPPVAYLWLGQPYYRNPVALEHLRCLVRTGTVPQ